MEVDEILDNTSYYRNRRFVDKRPDYSKGEVAWKAGDNIYKPLPDGHSQQLRSMHSHGPEENPQMKAHDLGGVNVLIEGKFHYFWALRLNIIRTSIAARTATMSDTLPWTTYKLTARPKPPCRARGYSSDFHLPCS
jgi:hypothetical protein